MLSEKRGLLYHLFEKVPTTLEPGIDVTNIYYDA